MATLVPDDGRLDAPLIIIGEAPGAHETAQRRPFVGPSGYRLRDWMQHVGLQRTDAYLTNVYPYQPPGNKIREVAQDVLASWADQLHARLALLHAPVVLVPTGDTALRALLGGRTLSISKARGSVFAYQDRVGRTVKVIPTLHPAATLYDPTLERACRHDWARIAADLQFPELRLPEREHYIKPSFSDLAGFAADVATYASLDHETLLSIDIETPRKRLVEHRPGKILKSGKVGKARRITSKGAPRITCVGLSANPAFSITVPTTTEYWGASLPAVWDWLRTLLASPIPKVMQNGLFDAYWLGLDPAFAPLRAWTWDTRWMHHALDPLDRHDLAYMASIDTREPYWKDDGKDSVDLESEWTDWETFQRYCGKDASVTRELGTVYYERLADEGKVDFYRRHYTALFRPLLGMMHRGLRLDEATRGATAAALTATCKVLEQRLEVVTGARLYGTTDLSNKKLATYLYETLKLPVQRDRKTRGVTTKEVVVRKLMLRHPGKLGSVHTAQALADGDCAIEEVTHAGPLILAHRRTSKVASFAKAGMADPDGYVRTQYGFTETLRLTSGKNPCRTGANLQNVDRTLRHMYVPEPGMFFLEVDASQGEDRIVKCLTGSERLIARARMAPHENDEHRRAAQVIWPGLPITPERRYLGKRTRHAGNYGLMGQRFSEELLKDGVVVEPGEAQTMIDTVIDQDTPEVRSVFQTEIRKLVLRDRCLANSWGQVWDFRYERLGDDLYRFGYACIPQSELVNLVNQYGLVPLDKWLRAAHMATILHHQNHDSLLVSTTPEEAYDVAQFLREAIAKPRTYWGVKLSMPVEIKCGLSWALPLEFKQWPDRHEFTARVAALLKGAP